MAGLYTNVADIGASGREPISQLTLQQLDGIFGAERNGGYDGFRWAPAGARSAKDDIRTETRVSVITR